MSQPFRFSPSVTEATLTQRLLEVGKHVDISPVILQRPDFFTHVDVATQNVVLGLRAYLLAEEGGKAVTRRTFYWQKLRPWWIPKFMWRRLREQREAAVAIAQPMFTYPQANIVVPDLGPVVFKVLDQSYAWDDDDG